MLSLNCKHVQHVKIYMPCNFEVEIKAKKYYNFENLMKKEQ
jgi:hypothetical protein